MFKKLPSWIKEYTPFPFRLATPIFMQNQNQHKMLSQATEFP